MFMLLNMNIVVVVSRRRRFQVENRGVIVIIMILFIDRFSERTQYRRWSSVAPIFDTDPMSVGAQDVHCFLLQMSTIITMSMAVQHRFYVNDTSPRIGTEVCADSATISRRKSSTK